MGVKANPLNRAPPLDPPLNEHRYNQKSLTCSGNMKWSNMYGKILNVFRQKRNVISK